MYQNLQKESNIHSETVIYNILKNHWKNLTDDSPWQRAGPRSRIKINRKLSNRNIKRKIMET